MSKIRKFVIDNLDIIKEMIKSKSLKEIYEELKPPCINTSFYPHVAKYINIIDFKEQQRKFNAFYFDEINSEDKAYFLGYIVADACLYKAKNVLILNSAEADKQVFENFIKYIEFKKGKYRITDGKNENQQRMIRMQLHSEHLLKSLNNLGIPFAKSKEEFGIPSIDKKYYNSFLTGYFDGDGCIYNWKHKNYEICFTEIQPQILKEIQEYLKEQYNITGQIRHRQTYYQLRISGRCQCYKFFKEIYNKDFALLRKYNKFLDVIPC